MEADQDSMVLVPYTTGRTWVQIPANPPAPESVRPGCAGEPEDDQEHDNHETGIKTPRLRHPSGMDTQDADGVVELLARSSPR